MTKDSYLGAKCLLAARGIDATPEAVVGAWLEVDTHNMIQTYLTAMAKAAAKPR